MLIYLTRIHNTDDKTSQELLVSAVTYYYGTHTTSPAVVLLLWRTDRLCLVLSSVHRIYFSWSSSEVLYRHTRMKMTPKEFYRVNPSSSKLQLCSVILSKNLLLLLLLHVVIRDKLWNMCLHTILKFEAFSKVLCNNYLLKIGIFDVWDIRKVFLFFERGGWAPAPPNNTVNSDISDSTGHNNVKFSSQENLLLLLIFQFV